jgi:Domain of unknown function (DUF4352)
VSEAWVYREPPQQPHQERGPGYTQVGRWQPQAYDPQAHRERLQYERPRRPESSFGAQPYQPEPRQPRYEQQPRQPQYTPQPQPQYMPQAQYAARPEFAPQPQFAPQSQYGPQPTHASGPPRRRGSHAGRNIAVAVAGIGAAVIVIAVAANSGHTVQTAGSAADTGSAGGTAPKSAGIGSAITLSGNTSGEQMAVTVVKAISSAQPGDEFTSAPAGDRLYAVQFRLRDTGSAAYSDAPSNGAAVVDSSGQSYQSALADTAAGCTSFPGNENIAPGSSGLGCIVFEVPKAAKIVSVQFTLDSGMGPQTGQWNVG